MRFMRETSRSEINVGVQEKLFRFFSFKGQKAEHNRTSGILFRFFVFYRNKTEPFSSS